MTARPSRHNQPLGKTLGLTDTGLLPNTAREGSKERSIFEDLMEVRKGKVREDIRMLENVFKAAPEVPPSARRGSARGSARGPQKTGSVLSTRQAQNIAILMKGLPLQSEALAEAIETLRPGPLEDIERLERFTEALPQHKELKTLHALADHADQLLDIERKLLPLARISRLHQHMRALCIAIKLEQDQEHLAGQLQSVQAACAELRASGTLRAILAAVLVMFNYANFGTAAQERAHAFDITTLLRLGEFKAAKGPFPGFHGLHFVVMRLLNEKTGITAASLDRELNHLNAAVRVNLSDVQTAIKSLHSDAQFLQKERREFPAAYGGQENPATDAGKPMVAAKSAPALGGAMPGLAAGVPSPLQPPDGAEPLAGKRQSWFKVAAPSDNMFRMVRGWARKKAGRQGNIQTNTEVPEVMPPKGSPAPVWLLKRDPESPSADWKRIWVEIRAPGVILCDEHCSDDVKEDEHVGRYVIVAGAEVVPVSSPLASLEARSVAEARPTAFELRNVQLQGSLHQQGGGRRLWLDSDDPQLAKCWFGALAALSSAPGAGFLWIKDPGPGIWRSRWAILHPSTSLFTWYRTPGEMLRGEPPIGGLELNSIGEIRTFEEQKSLHAKRHPYGFKVVLTVQTSKIEDMTMSTASYLGGSNSKSSYFCASSRVDMERWIQLLRTALAEGFNGDLMSGRPACEDVHSFIGTARDVHSFIGTSSAVSLAAPADAARAAPAPDNAPAPVPADTPAPGRADKEPSPAGPEGDKSNRQRINTRSTVSTPRSSATTDVSDNEDETQQLPIHKLNLLARRVDATACQLEVSHSSTLSECRHLVKYFGQACKDASPMLFTQQIHTLFATIKTFSAKLATAFKDVEKYNESCRRKGMPDHSSSARNAKEGASLFGFDELSRPVLSARGMGQSRWHWKQQLAAKNAASAAVKALIARSFVHIYARCAVERAVLKALRN